MAVLLAIIVGVASFFNYSAFQNAPTATQKIVQVVLFVLSVFALFIYRGRRTRKSYTTAGVRDFSFGFALCILAFLGSGGILAAIWLGLN